MYETNFSSIFLPSSSSRDVRTAARTGNISEVVRVEASSASGLEGVYVLDGLSGVSVSCRTTEEEAPSIRWYRYSSLGGGYAEKLSDVRVDGASSVLTKIESDMGYIVEYPDGRRECLRVIDYNRHPFSLTSIVPLAERDCQRIALDVIGMGEEMAYYGINGRRFTLDRESASVTILLRPMKKL